MSYAKTAELIEIPFLDVYSGLVQGRNHVLDWVQMPTHGRAVVRMKRGRPRTCSVVIILKVMQQGAPLMWCGC